MLYGSYRKIDVKELLKDSKAFGKEKLNLIRQRDAILGINSANRDVCVQTSNISNQTSDVAIKRLEITSKIEWIEEHQKALEIAMNELSEQENEVIKLFFFTKGRMMNVLVEEFADKYGIKKSLVYNINNKALRKLQARLDELL